MVGQCTHAISAEGPRLSGCASDCSDGGEEQKHQQYAAEDNRPGIRRGGVEEDLDDRVLGAVAEQSVEVCDAETWTR